MDWESASADVDLALWEYENARAWFAAEARSISYPLAVEVWVFDDELANVVLVEHRWRGWVPPGGAVEPGEAPREAAARELYEETGLSLTLDERPAAIAVRSYKPGWEQTLGISYTARATGREVLDGEDGQRVAWTPLTSEWESCFVDDRVRMARHARWVTDTATTAESC